MKVLDLQCQHHHRFEGWFASEDDFAQQLAKGLLECPVCADKTIVKMLSAPRLNLGAAAAASSPAEVAHAPGTPAQPQVTPSETADVQAAFLKAVRHVLANTENVGEHFAQEARKMHYGEAEARNIPRPSDASRDTGAAGGGHCRAASARAETLQRNAAMTLR